MKRQKKIKISVHAKGFGFWKVKKAQQRGIKIYRILRVDDEKFEIEHFGLVEFARRFVKRHNEDIQKALSIEASRLLTLAALDTYTKPRLGRTSSKRKRKGRSR